MKIKQLVLTAMFFAIMLLFTFTPLGFINLGVIKATLLHIPVIIASIVLGPRIGGLLGLFFGVLSITVNTITPSPLSFAFSPFYPVIGTETGSLWALVVALLPRILTGVVPFFVYRFLNNKLKKENKKTALFISGVSGSLVNTILVMNFIFFIFQDAYAQVKGVGAGWGLYKVILSVIAINGVPEAIIAGIATSAVASVLLKLEARNHA